MAAFAVLAASDALAQQAPAPAPKPAAPRPPAAAPKPPAQQPAAPAPQAQAPASPPNLIYSPWTKLCGKGQDPNAKQVCFTGKDAYLEAGLPVVAAVLIEPDGEPTKIFRITVPSPLQLKYGARLIIDQQQPLGVPFFTCFTNGCMADFEATPDLIGKLKQGQMLSVQAIHLNGTQIGLPLPLADFAKANEGAPTDPKVFEEQQKKRQEDMQKRQQQLQQQQGQPPK
jgi:invasion protein IalB